MVFKNNYGRTQINHGKQANVGYVRSMHIWYENINNLTSLMQESWTEFFDPWTNIGTVYICLLEKE